MQKGLYNFNEFVFPNIFRNNFSSLNGTLIESLMEVSDQKEPEVDGIFK